MRWQQARGPLSEESVFLASAHPPREKFNPKRYHELQLTGLSDTIAPTDCLATSWNFLAESSNRAVEEKEFRVQRAANRHVAERTAGMSQRPG